MSNINATINNSDNVHPSHLWYVTYDHIDHRDMRVYSKGFDIGVDEERCLIRFQMFDDDDNKIYSGFMNTINHAPLDCYGMPNAGCTYLKYKEGKVWKVL